MKRFYIDRLIVSGKGHEDSVIEFKPGVNFILGPSNTGKSLVMECIDYVFGFNPSKDHPSKIVDNNNGYEKVTLILSTSSGKLTLTRTIGEPRIYVSGAKFTPGYYSTNHNAKSNINSIYLHLLGINEEHKIRSAQRGNRTQTLTWRSILHLFFIKQADVTRESSPLLAPGGFGDTTSLAALLFLLTGQDATNLSTLEDPKITEGKRQALVDYLIDKVNYAVARRTEIEKELSSAQETDSYINIDQLRQQIAEIQSMINDATQQSHDLMSEIYQLNGKLSEARTVKQSFSNLRIQYQSDIKRIGFIVDCASNTDTNTAKVMCPICGTETDNKMDSSIIVSSAAELHKIKQNLNELDYAQESIDNQEENLIATINSLEEKRSNIDNLISEQLQPRLANFQNKLETHLKYIRLSDELALIRKAEAELRNELYEKETQEIPKETEYHIKDDYNAQLIHGFEERLRQVLKESRFGGAETARLNMDNFDIEINKLKKSVCSGGGNCGILNTITALTMSKYLIELNRHAPGFFAVDSSLTQLSESDYKEQNETIKQNFIEYLIKYEHGRQIIFVEQKKRMPFIPEEDEQAGIHTIIFTHDRNNGRYGFLNDVYNPEDQQ